MKHYQNPVDKSVWAYAADGSQDHLIPENYVLLSGDAVDAARTESYNTNPYDKKRAAEYPAIGDQLDDLFKSGAFSADMAAKIQAVKDKYPKG